MTALPVLEPEVEVSRPNVFEYVSASRLNLWLRCPLAFRLRYIDGIRTKPTASLFLGKAVHHALEYYYRHRQLGVWLTPEDVVAFSERSWELLAAEEQMEFDSALEAAALQQDARTLVTAYLAQVPTDEPRPLLVETSLEAPLIDPFTSEDLGIPLVGIVDLVMPERGGPVICDFKTAAKSNMPHEIMHEVQLTAYSLLFRNVSQTTERGLKIRTLVKTKTPKIDTHRYSTRTEAHFRRFFSLVRAYLDDLHAGRFLYRPGWTCGMCEFRDGPCQSCLAD